ncbi:hypothetical protein CsSME_00045145 [Camellia sinensis var. sinensis]
MEDDSGSNTEQKSCLTLKAMNGVNALVVVTDCCFHFITDKHNMQKQHAASELLSNIERMADKRFSRSTQAHNITSPTAMVNLNLTSSTRPKIHTSGFEQAMETFLANISANQKNRSAQLQLMKWWEEERKVFCGRADSFIALMHLIDHSSRNPLNSSECPWSGNYHPMGDDDDFEIQWNPLNSS